MTQYMFSVIHGELEYSGDEMQQIVAAVDAFNEKYKDITVFAGGLEAPETADDAVNAVGAPGSPGPGARYRYGSWTTTPS